MSKWIFTEEEFIQRMVNYNLYRSLGMFIPSGDPEIDLKVKEKLKEIGVEVREK